MNLAYSAVILSGTAKNMITYHYCSLYYYQYLEYSRGGWRLVVGGRGGRGGRYLGVGVPSAFGHICPVSYALRNVFAYSRTFDPLHRY